MGTFWIYTVFTFREKSILFEIMYDVIENGRFKKYFLEK